MNAAYDKNLQQIQALLLLCLILSVSENVQSQEQTASFAQRTACESPVVTSDASKPFEGSTGRGKHWPVACKPIPILRKIH